MGAVSHESAAGREAPELSSRPLGGLNDRFSVVWQFSGPMAHLHHPIFVVLSLLVAVFGSWTALDLFRRVRSHIGRTRLVWLGAAAVAMGVSIWSMHFIAMLGFNPGAPVDRKSTRLNSSHGYISYAVFCLKKKK